MPRDQIPRVFRPRPAFEHGLAQVAGDSENAHHQRQWNRVNDLQFRKEGKMRDQRRGRIAHKPANRALHGFARTDARREPLSPQRSPSVIGSRVSGKDNYEKQSQQFRREPRVIEALDYPYRDDVTAERGYIQHSENSCRRDGEHLAEIFILRAGKKLRKHLDDHQRRDDRDDQLMPSKIKSGEHRRRRSQPLNLPAARGQTVIFIKPEQNAGGGDGGKPDRPADPQGGKKNREKDNCAKDTGHRGSGEWGMGSGEEEQLPIPHSPLPIYEALTTASLAFSFKPPNRRSRF